MQNTRLFADYRERAQKTFLAEVVFAKYMSYLSVSRKQCVNSYFVYLATNVYLCTHISVLMWACLFIYIYIFIDG